MIYDKLGDCVVSQSIDSEPLDLFRIDDETPYEYMGQVNRNYIYHMIIFTLEIRF